MLHSATALLHERCQTTPPPPLIAVGNSVGRPFITPKAKVRQREREREREREKGHSFWAV